MWIFKGCLTSSVFIILVFLLFYIIVFFKYSSIMRIFDWIGVSALRLVDSWTYSPCSCRISSLGSCLSCLELDTGLDQHLLVVSPWNVELFPCYVYEGDYEPNFGAPKWGCDIITAGSNILKFGVDGGAAIGGAGTRLCRVRYSVVEQGFIGDFLWIVPGIVGGVIKYYPGPGFWFKV